MALTRLAPRLLALTVSLVFLGGCDIPRDPEKTLDRVTGGTMRVGYSVLDPWVTTGDTEPGGVEADLMRGFADSLEAEIEWVPGTEEDLAGALNAREIDVLIGGLESTSLLISEITLTHPYLTTATVVGVPPDSDIEEDITGIEVAVEAGTEEAGLLDRTDAIPVRVEDIAEAEGPRVLDSWLLDDLDLRDIGIRLEEHDHVLAVSNGENAWLSHLERYLLADEQQVVDLLAEWGRP